MKSKTIASFYFHTFCLAILLAIVFAAAIFISKAELDIIPKIEEEDKSEYVIHRTELVPWEDITSFIIDDGGVYILYDKTALVNVYGTDGSFKHGIQIATIPNGRGGIAILDGELYIESHRSIIFVFRDDQLIKTIDLDSNREEYISTKELIFGKKNTADGMYDYYFSESGNDIIKKDEQEVVVDLPEKPHIVKLLLLSIGLWILMWSLGSKLFFDKKKR